MHYTCQRRVPTLSLARRDSGRRGGRAHVYVRCLDRSDEICDEPALVGRLKQRAKTCDVSAVANAGVGPDVELLGGACCHITLCSARATVLIDNDAAVAFAASVKSEVWLTAFTAPLPAPWRTKCDTSLRLPSIHAMTVFFCDEAAGFPPSTTSSMRTPASRPIMYTAARWGTPRGSLGLMAHGRGVVTGGH